MKKSEWAAVAAGAAVVVLGAKRLWDHLVDANRAPWHKPQESRAEGQPEAVSFTGEPGEIIEITEFDGGAIRNVSPAWETGQRNPPGGFGDNPWGEHHCRLLGSLSDPKPKR